MEEGEHRLCLCQCKIFLIQFPPPFFFFPPHLPFLISVLLFFPPRDLIWTVICWQRSRCLACSLVNRTLCSLPSLSKLQIQLHIYLVEQFHSPGAFPRQPFLPLPSSSVNHLLQVTYMVTSLSMPPTTAEVPWMNSWKFLTWNTDQGIVLKQSWQEFLHVTT